MIGLIKKMINSDHREPLNNLMYIQDLVTSGQNGYVANSEEIVLGLIKSPNVLLNTTAKNEYIKALGKYTKANLDFIKHIAKINVNSHSEMVASSSAMQAVANSELAMNAIANSQTASQVVVNSTTAMQAIGNSQMASRIFGSTSLSMNILINNSSALQIMFNSQNGAGEIMGIANFVSRISNSSETLRMIARSRYAREGLMNNNSIFQANKNTMYNTIRQDSSRWVIDHHGEDVVSRMDTRVSRDDLFVFFCVGDYYDRSSDGVKVEHKNGRQAIPFTNDVKTLQYQGGRSNPLPILSGVSFGGCRFTEQGDGYVTIDAFAPR